MAPDCLQRNDSRAGAVLHRKKAKMLEPLAVGLMPPAGAVQMGVGLGVEAHPGSHSSSG